MLKIRVIFIYILLGQLDLNAQTFNISIDTMFVDIKEIVKPATRINLTHAVKYNDKYYCFFLEQGLYSFIIGTIYFLIVSDKGEILHNIEIPREIKEASYFDFFIRNGSLFAKTHMNHKCFNFDLNTLKWEKINEVDDRVYEDSSFVITYLDFGEWGQTTWFIDKQTKKEYVLSANGRTVNKLNGNYYLTGSRVIRIIENPRMLKQTKKNYYYRKVEKRRKFHEGTNSLLGSYTIYHLPWRLKEPKKYINTSFVANNHLFQLFSDSNQTYIGKVENNKLIPIQELGKKFTIYDRYYYLGKNLDNCSRFLIFHENNNTCGFLEINNYKINIHYLIHNQDSLCYTGNDGFDRLLYIILNKPDNFSIIQADSLEESIKGIDMKEYRTSISHNGYYPEKYSTQDVKTLRFIKVENKYLTQETEYLTTTQDNLVKSIFIQWVPTKQYNQSNSFFLFNDDNPEIIEQFTLKMNVLEKTVTEISNLEPEKEDRENGYVKFTWMLKNGILIELYGSNYFNSGKEIRMIINLE